MKVIQLLATDLDGTLIGSASEFPLYTSYREKVTELRRNYGTVWVACTGRRLRSFKMFFSPMRTMGMAPEFVVVNHAYIFEHTRVGYMPHIIWNLRIGYMVWINKLTARDAIMEWHDTITGVSGGVTTLQRTKSRLRLRFDSEDAARVASEVLEEKLKEFRHLQVFRSKDEVDVRSVPFTKGLAVSELAKHLGIRREEILTIGNGHNDISMLTKSVAGMVACPSNSEPEVLKHVHNEGGHVSGERSLGGVMDSINAYLSDTVDSSMPRDWVEPAEKTPHKPRRSQKKRKQKITLTEIVFFSMIGYAVLVVFANYGMIPFISKYIMIPSNIMLKVMNKVVAIFFSQ